MKLNLSIRQACNQADHLILPLSVCLALFNALLPSLLESSKQGINLAISSGGGHSFVIWFCLLLAVKSGFGLTLLTKEKHAFPIRPRLHLLGIIFLLLLILIPSASLSWIICALLCLLWAQQSDPLSQQRTTALIILAVAIRDPVCQVFLNLFADQILSFDARLSGIILQLTGTEFSIDNNTISQANGYSLLILTGCSAFHNLSLALLLWLSLSLFSNQKLITQDYLRAALLCIVVLGINGTRLALMATNHSWYLFLHDGNGALLIDALIVLQTLLFVRKGTGVEHRFTKQHSSMQKKQSAMKTQTSMKTQPSFGLIKLSIGLMLIVMITAPINRMEKTLNQPEIDLDTATNTSFDREIPQLRRIGLLDAANQGPYKITGFQHAQCEGSIALLPLYRNAEGSHILKRLIDHEGTRFGVIFKGKIHATFPQFLFIKERVTTSLKTLFSSPISTQHQLIHTLAFAEQGPCKVA
jgi:hypothetical protein